MADDNSTRRVIANAFRKAVGAAFRSRFVRRVRTGRRVPLHASIGVRLALLVLALGLPFIVYVGVNAARQASVANELAKQRTLAVAHAVAGRIDDVVADNLTTLGLVRHGVTIDAAATTTNDALLAKIRDDLPPFVHNVGVWTIDGRNVGLLSPGAVQPGASIADRSYFRRAAHGASVIEGPVAAEDDGKPVVVFAAPVLGAAGRVDGVVTLSTDLQQVQSRLDLEGAIPPGTVIAIVNVEGIVIARSVDSGRWIGKSILDVGKAREHMAQIEGVDETFGADHVARVSGFTQTKRTHWHVFVGMPADAALSAARVNVLDTVGLGVLSLLLGAAVSAWLGTRIARPLRRLAYDATLLARGNLAHRTRVAGDDETGVLASTLNRLAQTVEERTRALREKTAALEEKTTALEMGVGDLRAAHEKVEQSEQRLRSITDSIPSMVGYIDLDRRYRFNNRYYETWLQRPIEEITGRRVEDVLGPAAYANVAENLDRAFHGERVDFDVEAPGPAGSRFVRGSYVPHFDETGQVIGVYTSSTDITPLKEVERQLERLAQKDTLTGLPNRHAFNDGIAAALRRSQRSGTQVALLFLDVDGFKRINDTLGHAAGDDVLREFARRLTSSVRATDLVARLAGDEFVIVLEGIHTRDECRFVARKILTAMRAPFPAADVTIKVTTSIGIALGQGGATTPEALLKRADSALYAAKGQGRDTFEIAI